ncbi:uncharacterized protein LOC142317542 [Lycorma delicatula]|uniref:uncharacterized protein LOC142317542 n=1 Tax=Lycorma delicatula TaxID=130591 RepID=UPI003F5180BF
MWSLLLACLISKVLPVINVNISKCQLWTDCTLVLAWLSAPPSKWKAFVANWVAEIQNKTNCAQWSHVQSNENRADMISRGISPKQLKGENLWWSGPSWLHNFEDLPNQSPLPEFKDIPEQQGQIMKSFVSKSVQWEILTKYSSLSKLQRVIDYCIRFLNVTKKPKGRSHLQVKKAYKLREALQVFIKHVQLASFSHEIHSLKKHEQFLRRVNLDL